MRRAKKAVDEARRDLVGAEGDATNPPRDHDAAKRMRVDVDVGSQAIDRAQRRSEATRSKRKR